MSRVPDERFALSSFTPPWWLHGAHAQTLWHSVVRRVPPVRLVREYVATADGDTIALDWTDAPSSLSDASLPLASVPLVVILHGLEGSSRSNYVRGLLQTLTRARWQGVVLHFRGCDGRPNRARHSYHAGAYEDFAQWLLEVQRSGRFAFIACVGYSLGGNALLRWLGTTPDAPLDAAVAVSVPFELDKAADRLDRGASRFYQWYLLRHLKRSYRRKFAARDDAPLACERLSQLRDFWHFDDRITAPLHGFRSAEHYYRSVSCRPYLRSIRTPTLIVHARDDPFSVPEAIPRADELGERVQLQLSEHGGHVGFVTGSAPWRAHYWLEQRIVEYLVALRAARDRVRMCGARSPAIVARRSSRGDRYGQGGEHQ